MNIQWYPGHMTRAKRSMQEDVRAVDLLIELVDARAPLSTRNPDIRSLGQGKLRLIVMNKADLADPAANAAWCQWFEKQNIRVFSMDARSRRNLKSLMALIEKVCEEKRERDRKKGILNRPVRAMVAGIPNVGKSTLINTIAGRSTAKTGNRPGVTRGNQWIRLNRSVELLDTPGILWPKFEDQEIGKKIAFLGSVNEMLVQPEELASELIHFLKEFDQEKGLLERYGVTEDMTAEKILAEIALRRGCLLSGGEGDPEKAAGILMNEFRAGTLGRISLEWPEEEAENAGTEG